MTAMGVWDARMFVATFTMWSVMMIAMMTPSALPVLLIFSRGKAQKSATPSALLFLSGHLLVWMGFSVLATVAQWWLHRAMLLSETMSITNPLVSGVILIAIGVYQLTPLKAKCLTKCQNPVDFLMVNWRPQPFQIGLRHGLYCVGCCWALMVLLFVTGVMNIIWIAAITVFVLLEKFGPAGLRVARIAGAVMILAGLVTATRS